MPAASSFNRTITGTSDVSVDDAIARTLTVARDGYGEPDWFDVVTARGFISNGQVTHYQVTLKLGYEAASKAADAEDFYFQRACGGRRPPGSHHTIEARL
tara:strand:- start:3177 stop:3476 length:300 start_codon:yes stop_codon:yes gene_type:complete